MSTGFMVVAVADIAPEKENYKADDKQAAKALSANIARNRAQGRGTGQIMNMLVREAGRKFEVVNGNHRLKELQRQDIKNALVYNVGKVSREEAYRIAIETNETSFEPDDVKLHLAAGRLAEVFGAADIAATTTLTASLMSAGAGMRGWSWEAIAPEDKTLEPGDVVMLVCKVPVGKRADGIAAATTALGKAGIPLVTQDWLEQKQVKPGKPSRGKP